MALLVTADLAPGRIPLSTLTRIATESGGGTVDQIVDACSQTAWFQDIWMILGTRRRREDDGSWYTYTRPLLVPAGSLFEAMKTCTLYWIWGRSPESFAQNDGKNSANEVKAARAQVLEWLETSAKNGAAIEGIEIAIEVIDPTTNGLVGFDEFAPYSRWVTPDEGP